jgi:regulator of protease activity HflC (stomatin/prohibitin superfamily)
MPPFIKSVLITVLLLIGITYTGCSSVEYLDASDIMVVQYMNGNIETFTTSGPHLQGFGSVTIYPKRFHVDIENSGIQFSDRGHAEINVSSDFDMPLAKADMIALHQFYKNPEAVQASLIEKGLKNSIFTAGSLMTSKESSAEKRNDLGHYIKNQMDFGVFMTKTENQEIQEDTGKYDDKGQPIMAKKNVLAVHLIPDPKQPGGYARQERSATAKYGITSFNLTVTGVKYDKVVEEQFQEQQKLQMQTQKAIVQRNTSEQEAISAEANGRRDAAVARAKQEVIKAEQTTAAEARRDVAALDLQTADLQRKKAIAEGEGEAAKKRLIMQADGALTQKLAAYVEVQKAWATALATTQHPLTPTYVMGGGTGQNAATSLESLLSIKTIRDLGLNPNPGN